jgi:hypothetical protein
MGKGAGFEREFCKELSLWWTEGKRDDIFWRTAGSGARATTRFKKGRRTADSYGDVKAEHEIGKPLTNHYVFSLKRGYTGKKGKKDLAWANLLDIIDTPDYIKTKPAIVQWWEEIEWTQDKSFREHAFLVFKRDRKKKLICMAPSTFNYLERANCLYNGPTALVSTIDLCVITMPLESFFNWCQPEALGRKKRIIKRRKK